MIQKRKHTTSQIPFSRAFQSATGARTKSTRSTASNPSYNGARRVICNLQFVTGVAYNVVILLCLYFPTPLLAATPYTPTYSDPILEPWRWTTYPELNGLVTRCIAEDSTGAMWFGTFDGVRRYDSITWTAYTSKDGLVEGRVNALLTARDGSVYAGSEAGISRFKDGRWKQILPAQQNLTWSVSDIQETSDGSIWAATGLGALRIKDQDVYLYTTQDTASTLSRRAPKIKTRLFPYNAEKTWRIGDIFEDRSGALWFGLRGNDIVRCTVNQTELILAEVYPSTSTSSYRVHPTFTQTQDGTLWAIFSNSRIGIHQFDGKTWTSFFLKEKLPDQPAVYINANVSIQETKEGTLWIGNHAGILSVYRKGVWTAHRSPAVPVSSARIYDIFESSDGALWVAGLQEVCRLDYSNKRWATYEDLVYQGKTPDGSQWFLRIEPSPGYKIVRHHLKSNTWTQYSEQDGLIRWPYRLLFTRKGDPPMPIYILPVLLTFVSIFHFHFRDCGIRHGQRDSRG